MSEEEIMVFLARWSLYNRQEVRVFLWEEILAQRRVSRLAGSPPLHPRQLAPGIQVWLH